MKKKINKYYDDDAIVKYRLDKNYISMIAQCWVRARGNKYYNHIGGFLN